MKLKLATGLIVISALLVPMTSFATDVYVDAGTKPNDRHVDRAHPLTWVKDSMITTKIKAKLAADHPGSMKHIQVDTDADGIVWLTGTANNQSEINEAIKTARTTENVKSVWSDLSIENDR